MVDLRSITIEDIIGKSFRILPNKKGSLYRATKTSDSKKLGLKIEYISDSGRIKSSGYKSEEKLLEAIKSRTYYLTDEKFGNKIIW